MGGVFHGSACTVPRLRALSQASQESARGLAVRYGVNPKTVAKWGQANRRGRRAPGAEGQSANVSRGSHRGGFPGEDAAEETAEKRKRVKTCEIGYVHIDRCELRHADGRIAMFLAIDRVWRFT